MISLRFEGVHKKILFFFASFDIFLFLLFHKLVTFKMRWFLLLLSLINEVWGGPFGEKKTSETQFDEGYINSLSENRLLPKHSETALEYKQDSAVLEGDILLPRDRNAVNDLWPEVNGNVSVPYKIDAILEDRTDVITSALKMISDQTCLKFHQHTNETDYLYFFNSQGCASYVGCVGGEQPVLVGPRCKVGNICHEILHSLGLQHEHSRHDRGKHITILFENISPGMEDNFAEKSGNTLGLEYDLHSILHYGCNYFSSNGKPTILPKNSSVKIGQRTQMSLLDVQRIRRLYHCDRK